MNILIELNLNNSFSLAACVSGNVNLCDGAGNLTISGTSYLSNYLQELSTFAHSVNLLHGGNLEDYESFSFSLTDDGLTYELEKNDYSMNQGTVAVFTWDGTTKIPQWKGYVTGTELGENKITVKCENLSKGLKTLTDVSIYGKHKNLSLKRDTTIQNRVIAFETAVGVFSTHPKIKAIESPTITSNDTYKGISRTTATVPSITIGYRTQVFGVGVTYKALRVRFVSGRNNSKIFRVSATTLVNQVAGDYQTKFTLLDDFDSIDVDPFDRVEVYEGGSYFKLPKAIDSITNVSVLLDDAYYNLDSSSMEQTTINGNPYLIVYPSVNVYRDIPTSATLTNTGVLTKVYGESVVLSNAFDLDYTNYLKFNISADTSLDTRDAYFSLSADFEYYKDKELHFGSFYSHPYYMTNIYYFLHYYLKSGEIYPSDSTGTAPDYSADKAFYKVMDAERPPNSALQSVPNVIGATSLLAFNKSQMVKLPDPDTYGDIDRIVFTVRTVRTQSNVNDFMPHIVTKIGFFATGELDETLDEVFIDTNGKCNYLIPSFNFGAWPIGSNDAIAKDILTTLGQTSTSGFKFNYSDYVLTSGGSYVVSGVDYNHFYADSGTKSSDALETLAKEGLFVIAAQEDGTIYSRPLTMHQDDSKVNWSIPADDIISIEPLTDVEVSDIINLPTINFTDSSGNTESVEVISLETSAFPSLTSVRENERSYGSVFKFSDNFLSILKSGTTSSDPSLQAFLFLFIWWNHCVDSFKKNGISNSGSIDITTYYLKDILNVPHGITDDCAQMIFFNLIKMNAMRRKQLKFTLPLDYSISKKIRIGDRIKVYHPNAMQNSSIYGFVSTVETELLHEGNQVSITLLCDSYKDGADVNFFGI